MRKTIVPGLALSLILAATSAAHAQSRSGLGVGVETNLGADLTDPPYPPAITLTYDTGKLYAGGLLSFYNQDDAFTLIQLGGRVFFLIHNGDRSDFGVGGGINLVNVDPSGGESDTSFLVELGGRMRVWLSGNVAASAGVGVGILIADDGGPPPDDNAVGLLGNLMGSVGLSYFFW